MRQLRNILSVVQLVCLIVFSVISLQSFLQSNLISLKLSNAFAQTPKIDLRLQPLNRGSRTINIEDFNYHQQALIFIENQEVEGAIVSLDNGLFPKEVYIYYSLNCVTKNNWVCVEAYSKVGQNNYPESSLLSYLNGEALFQQKKYASAEFQFELALRKDGSWGGLNNKFENQFRLAQIYKLQGFDEKAQGYFEELVIFEGVELENIGKVWYEISSISKGAERFDALHKAIKNDPYNENYFFEIGTLYLNINVLVAEEFFQSGLYVADGWFNKAQYTTQVGRIYEDTHLYSQAEKWYQIALKESPDSKWSYINLARISIQQDKWVAAYTALYRLYGISSDNSQLKSLISKIVIRLDEEASIALLENQNFKDKSFHDLVISSYMEN
jgi:tetratricopeptide (TPR) repeat protein